MAPHSSTLAWKIPWMGEPGRLQSMGSLRVRYTWATSLSLFTFMHWRRKWQPTPVFLSEKSQGRGAWWAAVYGVAQSRTRLKWLSNSSKQTIKCYILEIKKKINSWATSLLFGLTIKPSPKFFDKMQDCNKYRYNRIDSRPINSKGNLFAPEDQDYTPILLSFHSVESVSS